MGASLVIGYIIIILISTALGRIVTFGASTAFLLFYTSQPHSFTMSADPVVQTADIDDEPYESAEDEDFQLDAAEDEFELSSDEEAQVEPTKTKHKTDKKRDAPEDIELDSGDEVTIKKAQAKRRKRKGKKDDDDFDLDDDEGGPGGFVRTRAMKATM